MRKNRKRFWALFLSVILLMPQTGAVVYAKGASAGGPCEHHPEHIGCSYREAVLEQPCGHRQHTADCYTDELICSYKDGDVREATESSASEPHKHILECYRLDCPHERGKHTGGAAVKGRAACGYAAAVKGRACDYTCAICTQNSVKDSENTVTTVTVTSFEELDRDVKHQEVLASARESDLDLPEELSAHGWIANGTKEGGEGTLEDAKDGDKEPEPILVKGVTWKLIKKNGSPTVYDESRTTPCIYYYRAVLPERYQLAKDAILPEIEVWYGMARRAGFGRTLDPYEDENRRLLDHIKSKGSSSTADFVEYDSTAGCVKLLDDVNLNNSYLYFYKSSMSGSTLDLNGYKLVGTGSYTIYAWDSTFTLTDNAGGGSVQGKVILYAKDGVASLIVNNCEITQGGIQFIGKTEFVVDGDFKTDKFMGGQSGRNIQIRNGQTLDLSDSVIAGQDYEIEILSDGGDWDTVTPLVIAKETIPEWYFKMPAPPTGYYLASTIENGNRTWTLKKELPNELKVSYTMPSHVDAQQKPLTVGRGKTLSLVLEPETGYVVKNGNIRVKEQVNGSWVDKGHTYDTDTYLLEVENVQNDLSILIIENIQLTYNERPDGGSITVAGRDGNPIDADKVVAPNALVRITATPNKGYSLSRLRLNGQEVESGQTHTITEPSLIEAEFQKVFIPPALPEMPPQIVESSTIFAVYQTLLSATGTPPLVWSVSDEAGNRLPDGLSLNADTGVIYGKSLQSGTFYFTVTVKDRNGKTASRQLSILIREPHDVKHVTGVQLSARTLGLSVGQTASLTAEVTPEKANHKAVTWSSDNPAVVTVDKSGLVSALGIGTANITVTTEDGKKTDTCAVTVAANYTTSGGGGGRSVTASRTLNPDIPELTVIGLPVSGIPAKATVDDGETAAAMAKAEQAAKRKGRDKYGIAMQYDLKSDTAYSNFSIKIERSTLERLISGGVKWLTFNTDAVDLTFDYAALNAMLALSTGDITLTVVRVTDLTGDMLQAAGDRPVYALSVNYTGADGLPAAVTDFGMGRVTVGIEYTPAGNEQTGGLYLIYGDDRGGVEWLSWSGYDADGRNTSGATTHFSLYGVGYRPVPAFADTAAHPQKADIDFAVSRGLMEGIVVETEGGVEASQADSGAVRFDPDGPITRGMFAAALGRLIGIDPSAYPFSGRFSDVPTAAVYTPFVEWAAGAGIMTGTGEKTFSPEGAITREQMALILRQYADKLGYTLPMTLETEIFADDSEISSDTFRTAVRQMQQAGVMSGRDGHRFMPRTSVTRAEAAAVLHRFVKAVIGGERVRD